jgi:hypothetical protein
VKSGLTLESWIYVDWFGAVLPETRCAVRKDIHIADQVSGRGLLGLVPVSSPASPALAC